MNASEYEQRLIQKDGLLQYTQTSLRQATDEDMAWILYSLDSNRNRAEDRSRALRVVEVNYYKMLWRWAWSGRLPKSLDDPARVNGLVSQEFGEWRSPMSGNICNALVTHYNQAVVIETGRRNVLDARRLAIVLVNPVMNEAGIQSVLPWYRKHAKETVMRAYELADERGVSLIPFYTSANAPTLSCPVPREG